MKITKEQLIQIIKEELDDDDHYGEPDDEKMAALTSLQAVLDQSDKEHMKSLVSALGECARAGIPAEDIIDTLALWADSE